MSLPICNNKIVVDLNKVQWARFYYENQYGQRIGGTAKPPSKNSIRCRPIEKGERLMDGSDALVYAQEQRLLDVWIPCVLLSMNTKRNLKYTGKKAKAIWKAWCAKQFGK